MPGWYPLEGLACGDQAILQAELRCCVLDNSSKAVGKLQKARLSWFLMHVIWRDLGAQPLQPAFNTNTLI